MDAGYSSAPGGGATRCEDLLADRPLTALNAREMLAAARFRTVVKLPGGPGGLGIEFKAANLGGVQFFALLDDVHAPIRLRQELIGILAVLRIGCVPDAQRQGRIAADVA